MSIEVNEVRKFVCKAIEKDQSKLKVLCDRVERHFKVPLQANDISFIGDVFREIVVKFLLKNSKEVLLRELKSGKLTEELAVEYVKEIRNASGIKGIPDILHDQFYAMMLDEGEDFFASEQLTAYKENVVAFLYEHALGFTDGMRTEKRVFDALITALREAYDKFNSIKKTIELEKYAKGIITLYDLAVNIVNNNIAVESYEQLQRVAQDVTSKTPSALEPLIRKEIAAFVAPIKYTLIPGTKKSVLEIKARILSTADIVAFPDKVKIADKSAEEIKSVDEIHLVCDTLHLDADLPVSFRGKSVALLAKFVTVHKEVTWDLSGASPTRVTTTAANQDHKTGHGVDGENGAVGESGGNCSVNCEKVKGATAKAKWTIKSKGANGMSGGNGGNGKDGQNGKSPGKADLMTINGMTNWTEILNTLGFKNNATSAKRILDDGFEKFIIATRRSGANENDILVLVKGQRGTKGCRGGLYGLGGDGGFAGKLQFIPSHATLNLVKLEEGGNGVSGKDGVAGINGKDGIDGTDAYMLLVNGTEHVGELGGNSYALGISEKKSERALKIQERYVSVFELPAPKGATFETSSGATYATYKAQSKDFELELLKSLQEVLSNAHDKFAVLDSKLDLAKFASDKKTFEEFVTGIERQDIAILGYAYLRDIATKLIGHKAMSTKLLRDTLKLFLDREVRVEEKNKVATFKSKIIASDSLALTSEQVESINEVHIVCDTLHIDGPLPETFRGKSVAVYANTINVHSPSEWNLSGRNSDTKFNANAGQHEISGDGKDGAAGEAGEGGGNCTVQAARIINPLNWTIIANGGNGAKGQDGGDGREGAQGVNANYENKDNLKIERKKGSHGKTLTIVKGKPATLYGIGGAGGGGGAGGVSGYISITLASVKKTPLEGEKRVMDEAAAQVTKHSRQGDKGTDGSVGKTPAQELMDGADYWFIQDNEDKKIKEILSTKFTYEIALSNSSHEHGIPVDSSKFAFPQIVFDVSEKRSPEADREFYNNLITALRKSYNHFDALVEKLKLREYIKDRGTTLVDVAKSCKTLDLDIPNVGKLKESAEKIKREYPATRQLLRNHIREFLAKAVVTPGRNNAYVEIKKKIVCSKEIEPLFNEYNEVRLCCDTYHVDKNLTAPGKNFAVLANHIVVHEKVKWNFSGKDATQLKLEKAGRLDSGDGIDGVDGQPGESGGHCSIECPKESIINRNFLTIVSNGGNGSDGQDGGNGLDGSDGVDATDFDFIFERQNFNEIFEETKDEAKMKKMKELRNSMKDQTSSAFAAYKENSKRQEKQAFAFADSDRAFMLVMGSNGKPGRSNGLGGLSGAGGFPGIVKINDINSATEKQTGNQMIVKLIAGNDGVAGKSGVPGMNGKNGSDMYRASGRKNDGNKNDSRFELDSIHPKDMPYVTHNGSYITVAKKIDITKTQRDGQKDKKRDGVEKAFAKEKKKIAMDTFKSQQSSYLSSHVLEKTEQSVQRRVVNKSKEATRKPSTSMDAVRAAHSQFLGVDKAALDELSRQYRAMTRAAVEMVRATRKNDIIMDVEKHKSYLTTQSQHISQMSNQFEMKQKERMKYSTVVKTTVSNEPFKRAGDQRKWARAQLAQRPSHNYADLLFSLRMNESSTGATIFDAIRNCNLSLERCEYLCQVIDQFDIKPAQEFLGWKKPDADIDKLFKTEPSYVIYHCTDPMLDVKTIRKLLQEKLMHRLFFYAYDVLYAESEKKENLETIFERLKDTTKTQFLRDTKDFAHTSQMLIDHFKSSDSGQRRGEALKMLEKRLSEAPTGEFCRGLFELLLIMRMLPEFNAIVITLNNFQKRRGATDESSLLREFYTKDEIDKFLKSSIETVGVSSLVYQSLLADESRTTLLLYAKERNEFKLLHTIEVTDSDRTLHVLRKEGTKTVFSILEPDMDKFARMSYQTRHNERITNFIEFINGNEMKSSPETVIIKKAIVEHVNKKEYKFGNMLEPKRKKEDYPKVEKIILSYLPKNPMEYEGTSDAKGFENNTQKYLKEIFKSDGFPILKALAVRFFNEGRQIALTDLDLFLRNVASTLKGDDTLVTFYAFLILSNAQSRWLVELFVKMLESRATGVHRTSRNEWRKQLLNSPKHNVFEMAKKVEDGGEVTFTQERIEHLVSGASALSPEYIQQATTDEIEEFVVHKSITTDTVTETGRALPSEQVDEETELLVRGLFEELRHRYGVEMMEKLLGMLKVKRETEIPSDFDLRAFLEQFKNGNWPMNERIIDMLERNPTSAWMDVLTKEFNVGKHDQRDIEKTVKFLNDDPDTSETIKSQLPSIAQQANDILALTDGGGKLIIDYEENDVKAWYEEKKKIAKEKVKENISLTEAFAVVLAAIKLKTKYKILLRNTQIISVLTMWSNEKGVLVQISTGEGKTFIGIAFAILKYIFQERVDIITSSNVLAERDANDEENKAIFDLFGIKIDHNCHESSSRRKEAYQNANILYGVLGNFQRDYLLTMFYDEDYMAGHHFENLLVDEVDSMLLDKGNNILYLSQDLPDIDELEGIFVFVWNYLNAYLKQLPELEEALKAKDLKLTKVISDIVFGSAYGIIKKSDIQEMLLADGKSIEKIDEKIENGWAQMINAEKIDEHGYFVNEYDEQKFGDELKTFVLNDVSKELADGTAKNFVTTLNIYCRQEINGTKAVRIPKYFKEFVERHLEEWIGSAIRAIQMRNEREYVLDRSRDASNVDRDPNVIIMDLDTGSDMANSQWDGGLHQFLQLKHGCKLSLMSLKSVFISNVSYFGLYKKKYGMTGTLGASDERKKLQQMHEIDYATVPRHKEQKYSQMAPIVCKNPTRWAKAIVDEVLSMHKLERSVLVICETIEEIRALKSALKQEISTENILVYKRDYEDFKKEELQSNFVIIATNLAGRGTDIKLSDDVKDAGGLHVILTYLPANVRIENQALGRAARAGAKGSGRLIVINEAGRSMSMLKAERDQAEKKRIEEIHDYYVNFIEIEEKLFEKFQEKYRKFGGQSWGDGVDVAHVKENFKFQWSMWLDKNSKKISDMHEKKKKAKANATEAKEEGVKALKNELFESFDKFAAAFLKEKEDKIEDFLASKLQLMPAMRLKIFKHLIKSPEDTLSSKIMKKDVLLYSNDLASIKYYELFDTLKELEKSKGEEGLKKFSTEDRNLILECVNEFKARDRYHRSYSHLVNRYKSRYETSLVRVEGYERQHTAIKETEEAFIDSLYALIGKPLTPASFALKKLKGEFLQREIYNILIRKDVLSPPRVAFLDNRKQHEKSLTAIALKHNVNFSELADFLSNCNSNISSFPEFTKFMEEFQPKVNCQSCKTEENETAKPFNLPSREKFWTALCEKGLMKDVKKFVLFHNNMVNKLDPRLLHIQPSGHLESFPKETNRIYMHSIAGPEQAVKTGNSFLLKLEDFDSNETFKVLKEFLLANDAIHIIESAVVDMEKLKPCVDGNNDEPEIFTNYYNVSEQDFSDFFNRATIFKMLQGIDDDETKSESEKKRKQIIVFNSTTKKFQCVIENLPFVDLGKLSVFEDAVMRVLKHKSAYRIALRELYRDVELKRENVFINLHTNPCMALLSDLLEHNIIEMATVKAENVEDSLKCCEIIDKKAIEEDIERHNLPKGIKSELPNDLSDLTKVSLSNYKAYEGVIQTFVDNRKALKEASKDVKDVLLKHVAIVQDIKNFKLEFTLRPLTEVRKKIDGQTLQLFQLKGLDQLIHYKLSKNEEPTSKEPKWWEISLGVVFIALAVVAAVAAIAAAAAAIISVSALTLAGVALAGAGISVVLATSGIVYLNHIYNRQINEEANESNLPLIISRNQHREVFEHLLEKSDGIEAADYLDEIRRERVQKMSSAEISKEAIKLVEVIDGAAYASLKHKSAQEAKTITETLNDTLDIIGNTLARLKSGDGNFSSIVLDSLKSVLKSFNFAHIQTIQDKVKESSENDNETFKDFIETLKGHFTTDEFKKEGEQDIKNLLARLEEELKSKLSSADAEERTEEEKLKAKTEIMEDMKKMLLETLENDYKVKVVTPAIEIKQRALAEKEVIAFKQEHVKSLRVQNLDKAVERLGRDLPKVEKKIPPVNEVSVKAAIEYFKEKTDRQLKVMVRGESETPTIFGDFDGEDVLTVEVAGGTESNMKTVFESMREQLSSHIVNHKSVSEESFMSALEDFEDQFVPEVHTRDIESILRTHLRGQEKKKEEEKKEQEQKADEIHDDEQNKKISVD